MEIITKIKPLYNGLIDIGLPEFIKDIEFVRLCNELEITSHYTEAFNEVSAKATSDWSFLGIDEMNYNHLLAVLLNKMYSDPNLQFASFVSRIVASYLPLAYYITSISTCQRDLHLLGASRDDLRLIDSSWGKVSLDFSKKVVVIKDTLISRAEGGYGNDDLYVPIRKELMNHPRLGKLVPEFVVKSNNIYEFWQYIKIAYGTYAERRMFLKDAFEPLLQAASNLQHSVPHHDLISQIISIDEQFIAEAWNKALLRSNDDPEAAITSSRTLIEVVCKHILDEMQAVYDETVELPKLYKQTASILNLSPDQHSEQLFKQILGGCQTVVEGLGGLRNKFGDAHGVSRTKAKPAFRHASLAVNLSGAMCSFLLQTYNFSKEKTAKL